MQIIGITLELSASFLFTSGLLSKRVKSDGVGDIGLFVRKETAWIVSSSSVSGRDVRLPSSRSLHEPCWSGAKDLKKGRLQRRESSEKLAEQGEVRPS